jgi:prolyl-tRNA editing enzyme YbaK/EbsC (Cys-tRNA(Pro) deacylase)
LHLDNGQVESAFDLGQFFNVSTRQCIYVLGIQMPSEDKQSILSHPGVMRVREALARLGMTDTIIAMAEATHTAQAAADALGCIVGEIAKSIIFRAEDGRAVLVITSGSNRVDDSEVASLIGQSIAKADADFVKVQTGFVIGGVAPVAHAVQPIVLMDQDLMQYAKVWPAAGHPNTMFHISPADLARITSAHVADIAQRKNA